MSPLHYYYKMNMFLDIIVLVSSTTFWIYNITSCNASCDYGHMPLCCLRKEKIKENQNQKKKYIKLRKNR